MEKVFLDYCVSAVFAKRGKASSVDDLSELHHDFHSTRVESWNYITIFTLHV